MPEFIENLLDADPFNKKPIEFPKCNVAEGIYFGMPENEYHEAKALSNSGMKKLIISPLEFWENFFNPEKEEEETSAQAAYGKALHRYILEPDTFMDRYCFMPEDAPRKPTSSQRNAKKPSADSILAIQYWDEFNKLNEGKELIKQEWLKDFQKAEKMLQYYPEIKDSFKNGYAEVSIFLEIDGIMFKCRIDYLKPSGVEDLKSYSNSRDKPIDETVKDAITYEKYNLQYYIYYWMLLAVKKRLKAGTLKVFGLVNEQFLHDLVDSQITTFALVFQGSAAPYEYRRIELMEADVEGGTPNLYWTNAEQMFQKALGLFKHNWKKYGTEPWIADMTNYALSDAEIPQMMYQKF